MAKLSSEQKTITTFMGERRNLFLIPDYQRPYTWDDDECSTLWNDLYAFAFPDGTFDKDNNDYFLGPLVLFKNANGQLEVIDGQQRLITLTLLLRALYQAYSDDIRNDNVQRLKNDMARCLWKEPGVREALDKTKVKIASDISSESDRYEFLHIMLEGKAHRGNKSRYALNYKLFQARINEHLSCIEDMIDRILNNCSLLPIEAEDQDTALQIFSTFNDRGKPLSDSDIFKSKLYKAYRLKGRKDEFIARWKKLEDACSKFIVPGNGSPVDDLFMRYMHCVRAVNGIRDTSVSKLRDFYGRDDEKFSLLNRNFEKTFDELIILAEFWRDVYSQDRIRFSERVLKRLFVLHYTPNNTWTFLVSVYFMTNRDKNGLLEEESFYGFLKKITAFILAARIMIPGNSTPFFIEMVNIAKGLKVTFSSYEFDAVDLKSTLFKFDFNDSRKITRGMIAWQVFTDESQELLPLDTRYDTEHIYPRKRRDTEGLADMNKYESLGNKSLLEKRINIRENDYRFADRKKYYRGFETPNGRKKQGTKIHELVELAESHDDFKERDIELRNNKILEGFIRFIRENDLTK